MLQRVPLFSKALKVNYRTVSLTESAPVLPHQNHYCNPMQSFQPNLLTQSLEFHFTFSFYRQELWSRMAPRKRHLLGRGGCFSQQYSLCRAHTRVVVDCISIGCSLLFHLEGIVSALV